MPAKNRIPEPIPPAHWMPGIVEIVPPSRLCQHAVFTQEYRGSSAVTTGVVRKTCHNCGRVWEETY